jgi:hypothetical protein
MKNYKLFKLGSALASRALAFPGGVSRLIEGFYKKKLPQLVTFVDFAKAFDSINREIMWLILLSYGIPNKIVNAIKTVYNN